jgi:hypothetical protein
MQVLKNGLIQKIEQKQDEKIDLNQNELIDILNLLILKMKDEKLNILL